VVDERGVVACPTTYAHLMLMHDYDGDALLGRGVYRSGGALLLLLLLPLQPHCR